MSLLGNFNLEYKGQDPKRFLRLFGTYITFGEECFDILKLLNLDLKDSVIFHSKNYIRWYELIGDMKAVTSQLYPDDSVSVEYQNEDGEKGQILFKKEKNGAVSINQPIKSWVYNDDGQISFTESILYMIEQNDEYRSKYKDLFTLNTWTLEGYIRYLAHLVAEDEGMLPAVREFVYDSLSPEMIQRANSPYYTSITDENTNKKLKELREHFVTEETAKAFLTKKANEGLLYWIPELTLVKLVKQYPEEAIKCIGDKDKLQKFIDEKSGRYYGGSTNYNETNPKLFEAYKRVLNINNYVLDRHMIVYDNEGKRICNLSSAGGYIYDNQGTPLIHFQHTMHFNSLEVVLGNYSNESRLRLYLSDGDNISSKNPIFEKIEITIPINDYKIELKFDAPDSFKIYEMKASYAPKNNLFCDYPIINYEYGSINNAYKIKKDTDNNTYTVKEVLEYIFKVLDQAIPGITSAILEQTTIYRKMQSTSPKPENEDKFYNILNNYYVNPAIIEQLLQIFPLSKEVGMKNSK